MTATLATTTARASFKPRAEKSGKSSKPRRESTPEQAAAAKARRASIRHMFAKIAAMPMEKRILLAHTYGIRTAGEGHELSPSNQLLLVMQCPRVSVVGGFQQWREAGRAVRKGEKALAIWVPIRGKSEGDSTGTDENGESTFFILGNVFDISQTYDITLGPDSSPLIEGPARPILDNARLLAYGCPAEVLALPAPGESSAQPEAPEAPTAEPATPADTAATTQGELF